MPTPAQQFVPIKEIRDDVVILKNGALRKVIMASTINFALKSKDEQESILYQFQNFLNTIDFTIQICVQSRRLDIRPYINLLEERQKEQVNDLLKIQTREYIEFIRTFTEKTNIMAKRFYIIVPYTPPTINADSSNFIDTLKGFVGFGDDTERKEETADERSFRRRLSQLEERISVVEQGLMRTGIRTGRLGTNELTELYYRTLNPGETDITAE